MLYANCIGNDRAEMPLPIFDTNYIRNNQEIWWQNYETCAFFKKFTTFAITFV